MQKECSVVILSAGFSSRMKQAKFALKFDEKSIFLEKIIEEFITFGCREINVVMNKAGIELLKKLDLSFPKNVSIILNKHPERERFYSLQTGLKTFKEQIFTFIHNVDNPFVDQDLLNLLFEQKEKADYIIPVYKGKGGHPILISGSISKQISIDKDYRQNLKDYLKQYNMLKVESLNQLIIRDINNENEYSTLFNELRK